MSLCFEIVVATDAYLTKRLLLDSFLNTYPFEEGHDGNRCESHDAYIQRHDDARMGGREIYRPYVVSNAYPHIGPEGNEWIGGLPVRPREDNHDYQSYGKDQYRQDIRKRFFKSPYAETGKDDANVLQYCDCNPSKIDTERDLYEESFSGRKPSSPQDGRDENQAYEDYNDQDK